MTIKNHIRELEKGQLLSRLAILTVTLALLFLAGTFCLRTITTGFKLSLISNEISSITEIANNSPDGWSDEKISEYNEQIEKRNALINSDDEFVSLIATSNTLVRLAIFIALFTLVCLLTYLFFKLIVCEYAMFNKYLKYKKHQQKKVNRS